MRQYRAVHPSYVAIHGADPFEADYTAIEERDWLDRGLLELVPHRYKVVGPHAVYDTAPGDTFERAFRIDEEAHLLDAGHIIRVGGPPPKPEPSPSPRRRRTPKE